MLKVPDIANNLALNYEMYRGELVSTLRHDYRF